MRTCIRAFARIHLGFYTYPPHPTPWRGAGIYLSSPHITVCITDGDSYFPSCMGDEQIDRITQLVGGEYGVEVHGCIPPHRGLGSSTQLYMATAKALSLHKGVKFEWRKEAVRLGRHRTSRVGALLFNYGGLVVDGSRKHGNTMEIKPLYRVSLPRNWRIILVDSGGPPGPKEEWEENTWDNLPCTSGEFNAQGGRIITLIKHAADVGDPDLFLEAILKLDMLTGEYFSMIWADANSSQSIELIDNVREAGINLMQSSWGPTLYTITGSREAAIRAVKVIREALATNGLDDAKVSVVQPRNRGSTILVSS
ncbi:MAG: hypothetical protein F7B59_02280 [Desulfurococcales archaeon]|nr:hypothetical protein [Desulfurococcales archaeon]